LRNTKCGLNFYQLASRMGYYC